MTVVEQAVGTVSPYRRIVRAAAERSSSFVSVGRILPVTLLLIAVVIANWRVQPNSISTYGLQLLLDPAIPVVFASLAQMFVVLAGDFDVGVGSAIGLANVLCATMLTHHTLLAIPALGAIILGYVFISLLRDHTGVPTVVVTLGASFVWLGIGLEIQATPGGESPSWLSNVADHSLPVIPEPIYIALALTIISILLLRRWRYGVVLRGLGSSPTALAEAGRSLILPRVVLWSFAGLCVVLAGLYVTVISGGSDVNASSTLTLSSFATLVVGGCEMSGGIVEPLGVVLASISLGLIASLLTFENISASWVTAVTGFILIAAMSLRWFARRGRGDA